MVEQEGDQITRRANRASGTISLRVRLIPRRRHQRLPNRQISRVIVPAMALVASLGWMGTGAVPARANTVTVSNYQGFDGCQGTQQPSVTDMSAFFRGTSFWQYYLYLGGSDALCGGPASGVTAAWVSSVLGQGWGIVGTWVGPQCCSNSAGYIPYNLTSARSLGVTQADDAVAQMVSWGLNIPYFPVAYDFESTPSNGISAENAFIGGWDSQLNTDGYIPGGYGSTCNSGVQNWAAASPGPGFVWPADWSHGSNSVWGLSCLSDGDWIADQRHHQYRGTHSVPENGVSLSIDSDCGNSFVASESGQTFGDQSDSGAEPTTVAGAKAEDGVNCNGSPT
jgi:hypothetical protein